MYYDKILLDKIFNKTGIYITNKNECKLLSQIIANEKIGYLSESTLYRIFLNPNSNHKPYKNTLNILAQFCDYSSWDAFVNYCDSVYLFTDPAFLNKTFDTIITDFVNQQKFNSLIDVFDSVESISIIIDGEIFNNVDFSKIDKEYYKLKNQITYY